MGKYSAIDLSNISTAAARAIVREHHDILLAILQLARSRLCRGTAGNTADSVKKRGQVSHLLSSTPEQDLYRAERG